MNLLEKHWFWGVNVIAFIISMFDGYIWRGANGGFPICTLFGCTFASIVGGIYQIIYIIKNVKGKKKLLECIVLYFTLPFYGVLGGMVGLIIGFSLFKL